ncbi:hypothetical protein AB0878_32110 [Amycolatopsis sp. NPDC047767]|uniref:hypothetical protein n=1 Tax=Amycolatopsis sp. NPDC047767 TaxID=3156765 RepID=UPI003452CFD9
MVSRRRTVLWLCGAGLVLCAGLLVISGTPTVWLGRQTTDTRTLPAPTRAEAEALLSQATGFARAHDYAGLCQTVAQDVSACQKVLDRADISHVAPSPAPPAVEGARSQPDNGTIQGAEVLHIRGTRADGTSYTADFSAVPTTDGQIRSQNAVYWFSRFDKPA